MGRKNEKMKILSFIPRRPTPERLKAAVEATKRKAVKRQFLKSVKYCQRCGKEVYPDKNGRYPLYEVKDERYEITLLVCENCKEKSNGGEK